MRVVRMVVLTLVLATAACGAGSPPPARADRPVSFLGTKGVNVHNWFTWTRQLAPDRFAYPAFQNQPGEVAPDEAAALRRTGFDFVRLTVDPGVFLAATPDERAGATQALAAGVDRLLRAGLSVIVDLHGVATYQPADGGGAKGADVYQRGVGSSWGRAYQASAAVLAGEIDKRFGGTRRVAFEAFNEPTLPCGSTSWRAQQAALHRAIRAAAPRLTLVLNGSCWDTIDGLLAVDPADYADANTLYTFHFYEPFPFTHQGVTGGEPAQALSGGFPYPWNARPEAAVRDEVAANLRLAGADTAGAQGVEARLGKYLGARWSRASIDARMDRVAEWADAHGIAHNRLLMGEFGVNAIEAELPGSRDDDRYRWLSDVRTASEQRGFRWAFWAYKAKPKQGFRLVDTLGVTDKGAIAALGLNERHETHSDAEER